MHHIIIGILVFCILFQNTLQSEFIKEKVIPAYINVCRRSDPNVNSCIKKSIEMITPNLKDGMKELSIPSCEPLVISEVNIAQNAGAIRMESRFNNIIIRGLTNFTIVNVVVDPKILKFRIKMWFPNLQMKSNYTINGKVLLLPLAGHGTCMGNYSDIDITATLTAEKIKIKSEEYLKATSLDIEFNLGHASVQLNDLFNGDTELGEVMNNFLNENWRIIAAEIRPALEESISNIIAGIVDRMFNSYTLEQLFPE